MPGVEAAVAFSLWLVPSARVASCTALQGHALTTPTPTPPRGPLPTKWSHILPGGTALRSQGVLLGCAGIQA